jgi:hypothetical protein
MIEHKLHQVVGDIVVRNFGEKVKLDFACCKSSDSRKQLPLFSSEDTSRETQLCKVDMLIVSENKVKVVLEIEESGRIPTKICGKFLTTGLAKLYKPHKGNALLLASPLLFIQVLSSAGIPDKSSIPNQLCNIERAMRKISNVDGRQMYYLLFVGEPNTFESKQEAELIGRIEEFLKTGRIEYGNQ